MKIYNNTELEFLNTFWENIDYRKSGDRSYEFAVLTNDNNGIIEKLLNWFEIASGEKLKHKNYNLIIHKFNVGDWFDKHTDNIDDDYENRAYVLGFHINEDYEGGDYKLYNPDITLDKTPGIPYFFKSNRVHEITKITSGYRKSGLIFISYDDLIKTHLI